jgi:hypothetical protein
VPLTQNFDILKQYRGFASRRKEAPGKAICLSWGFAVSTLGMPVLLQKIEFLREGGRRAA